MSLEQRGAAPGDVERTASQRFAEAVVALIPQARPVSQGMERVVCPEGRTDREPNGCPIVNGWPILFIDSISDEGSGEYRVRMQVKSQYGNRSHSGGVMVRLHENDDGEWQVLDVVELWAT